MADELTPQQEELAAWMATPKPKRRETLQQIADRFGQHISTLYRWKKSDAVKLRAQQIVDDAYGGAERVAQVVDALFQEALKPGATKQKELYLRYAGMLVDRRVYEHTTIEAFEDMSAEDLKAEFQDVWDEAFEDIVGGEEWDGDDGS